MRDEIRFPEGLTVKRIDDFLDALDAELMRQADIMRKLPMAARAFDRTALRNLFERHGFGVTWGWLGVLWDADTPTFLASLRAADEDQLGLWRGLLIQYPDGVIPADTDPVDATPGEDGSADD